MKTLTLADAERAMNDARRHLDVAARSDDEAVKRDRYKQAAQRLSAAAVLRGLAPEEATPGWGMNLSLPGRASLPVPVVPGPGR